MAKSVIRRIPLLLALAGILLAFYARYIEPRRLEITRINRATGSDPLTVAFVTDIHIGPHFRPADLEPTISALEDMKPDVLLFGGDFISESPRYLHDLEAPLTRMVSTAKIGSWGIWGNHDIANLTSRIEPVLQHCGITMLTNASVQLRDDLWLVGIDDVLLGRVDLVAAFANVPEEARVIALLHEPDAIERLVPYQPMLTLCGHTHGGQVRLPVIGALAAPKLGKQYLAGEFDVDGMPLYVSRGIGMYRPPVRLFCRPELHVFTVD